MTKYGVMKGSLHKHEHRDFTWHSDKCDELRELLEDIVISARAGNPVNHEMRHRWNQSWTGTVIDHIMEYLPRIYDCDGIIADVQEAKQRMNKK